MVLWCLTPLSTIFQLYRGGQFYWWRKPEEPEKENHRPVASHWQTLSHNVVHLALIVIRTHNISAIDTDCIGSCKSNNHTITATTASHVYMVIYSYLMWVQAIDQTIFPDALGKTNVFYYPRPTAEGNRTFWSFPIPREKLFDLLPALTFNNYFIT